MANRTKWTAKKKRRFLEVLIETGGHVTVACNAVRMSRSGAYDARNTDPEFAAAWDEAVDVGTVMLEEEAYSRAFHGVLEPQFHRGQVCGYVRKCSDVLLMFLLKGRKPEMYRERSSVELTGAGGGPVQVQQLSDEELLRIAAKGNDGGDADNSAG